MPIVVQGGTLLDVEPAEGDGAEVGGPDVVVDLFEADEVAAEQVADVDPLRSPSDPAVGRDLADLEVSGILGRLELVGELSIRGLIDGGGRLLAESLVRPDLVEIGSEGVEAPLLRGAVGGGREGGFRLEIPVHALVPTVLVRGSGLDEVGRMPSLIHQMERRERRPRAMDAKGVPLSVRIRSGRPNSWKSRVKTRREPV